MREAKLKTRYIVGASFAGLVLMAGPAASTGAAGLLAPITLSETGADAKRRPFARWTPAYPIVNILVSTRAVTDPDTRPARRYWVQADTYGSLDDGPEPFWRGDDPLIPGVYYTAIQGDAPLQANMPWTPSKRFRVKPRPGEWTGPTSQKRYIRFKRPRGGALRGLAFSVYARSDGCEAHSSFSLPGRVLVLADGSFSARYEGVWNVNRQSTANIRIKGRVRSGFARGELRVTDLFEGCKTGRVRWSARRR